MLLCILLLLPIKIKMSCSYRGVCDLHSWLHSSKQKLSHFLAPRNFSTLATKSWFPGSVWWRAEGMNITCLGRCLPAYTRRSWLFTCTLAKEVCSGCRCCRGGKYLFSTVGSNARLKWLLVLAEPFIKQNATYLGMHQTHWSACLPSATVTSWCPPHWLVEMLRASISQRQEGLHAAVQGAAQTHGHRKALPVTQRGLCILCPEEMDNPQKPVVLLKWSPRVADLLPLPTHLPPCEQTLVGFASAH